MLNTLIVRVLLLCLSLVLLLFSDVVAVRSEDVIISRRPQSTRRIDVDNNILLLRKEEEEQQQHHRNLVAQPLLIDYEPVTKVSDYATIDLDLMELTLELEKGHQGFTNARSVYQNGANVRPYAVIGVTTPLLTNYSIGTYVAGNSSNGPIGGTLMTNALEGDSNVLVSYEQSSLSANNHHDGCRVGGSAFPLTNGCFQAAGEIWIGADVYGYDYNIDRQNLNNFTLHKMSYQAEETMYSCDQYCPYEDYDKFYKYYGEYDYADEFLLAAFVKGRTILDHGNIDFSKTLRPRALNRFVQKAIVLLNVWMYVINQMEKAIDTCNNYKCSAFSEEPCGDEDIRDVHNWDQAVALYVGSEQKIPKENEDPNDSGGFLLYMEGNKHCQQFNTCGPSGGGTTGAAQVNHDVLRLFDSGKQYLLSGNCVLARRTKEAIVLLMTIPLIQGTLFNAYFLESNGRFTEEGIHYGLGAAYAASVLPIVHACNQDDANTIYDRLHPQEEGSGTDSSGLFADVKAALENNYDCMGITCSLVGGILDLGGRSFRPGAEPCGNYQVPWYEEPEEQPPQQPSPPQSPPESATTSGNSGNSRPSGNGGSGTHHNVRNHNGGGNNTMRLVSSISAAVLVLLSGCCVLVLCRTWKTEAIVKDGDEHYNYGVEITETPVSLNGDGISNGTSSSSNNNNSNLESASFTIT